MLTQKPQVTATGHRLRLKLWGSVIGFGEVRAEIVQDPVDLGRVEACRSEIKTLPLEQLRKLGELPCQHLSVPAGVLGQLVVGNCEQALLGFGEPDGLDGRHHLQAEQLRCREPPMSGKDHVVLVDHDRLKIAGALDAVGDAPDLALRACSRVARIRLQRRRRSHLYLRR